MNNYEGWVTTCMEIRVEGRRPIGRPVGRQTKRWLETVEVDMVELEFDREDIQL